MVKKKPSVTKKEIAAARLRNRRRIAAMLLEALADDGCKVSDAMARLGRPREDWWHFIHKLVDEPDSFIQEDNENVFSPDTDLEVVSDFLYSIGGRSLDLMARKPTERMTK